MRGWERFVMQRTFELAEYCCMGEGMENRTLWLK